MKPACFSENAAFEYGNVGDCCVSTGAAGKEEGSGDTLGCGNDGRDENGDSDYVDRNAADVGGDTSQLKSFDHLPVISIFLFSYQIIIKSMKISCVNENLSGKS
ncbi:Hypothetical predicted protein [Octopus vulgaris]|uniref:Uncharacterized protein n=1 Tax=Octopus vulgaris TaxID=6645 RepID=A0AA36B8X8_OCTVU|nr:Hypothetical predicted protein [Octopus vulgaris]